MNKKPSQTLENYLRTIRSLEIAGGTVRSVDVAAALGVSRPTTHTALARLARYGLVRHDRYSSISLTESGRAAADQLLEKHRLARKLLEEILKTKPETAEAEICAIEHLSRETLASLVELFTGAPCGQAR